MEYQKIIILLDNTPNQSTKINTINWVDINDDSHGTYNTDSQIKFKTSLLRSSLYDYSDAYILSSKTITITGAGADDTAKQLDKINKGVIFKSCAPFADYMSEINNTQIDHAKYIDVAMPIHNLIEYSINHSETSGILWLYYRDEPISNIANYESF